MESLKDINIKGVLVALLGGIAVALAAAGPIVDDGVTPSEIIAIAGAFLAGTGATGATTPNLSRKAEAKK